MNENQATAGVPLFWVDNQTGYQCPMCALFVCIPSAVWATCPTCSPIPIDEVAGLALANAGFDEDDSQAAVDAIRPLLDALGKASLTSHTNQEDE